MARSRGAKRLALEAAIVLGTLLAVAGGIGVFAFVKSRAGGLHNDRPIGGPQISVSHVPDDQSETTVAVDPSNARVLLAGSNDRLFESRVYSSTDGGRTWTSRGGPPLGNPRRCGVGDPAVAIAPNGRQYYAFLIDRDCYAERMRLFVAARAGPRAGWRTVRVDPHLPKNFVLDDKPAITVDDGRRSRHRGRVYVTWRREFRKSDALLISHSDDGGATWSKPQQIGPRLVVPYTSSVDVAPNGAVFVALADFGTHKIWLARSEDGEFRFSVLREVDVEEWSRIPRCTGPVPFDAAVPAQPHRCVGSNPTLAVDHRYAYVFYADGDDNGTAGVFVARFDLRLRRGHWFGIGPGDDGRTDQFSPAGAVDPTTGDLWACYYDTAGDDSRRHAWYTCTLSLDRGRTWTPPVRAASAPSDETRDTANINDYGDYEGLAVLNGVAHPIWTDSRDYLLRDEEVYSSVIRRARMLAAPRG